MKNKQFVYICAPFRADTESSIIENIKIACEYAKSAWVEGYTPIVPHTNSRGIFGLYGDDKEVTEFDMNLLSKCDFMRVCGVRISDGMQKEIDFCRMHKITIEYIITSRVSECKKNTMKIP